MDFIQIGIVWINSATKMGDLVFHKVEWINQLASEFSSLSSPRLIISFVGKLFGAKFNSSGNYMVVIGPFVQKTERGMDRERERDREEIR